MAEDRFIEIVPMWEHQRKAVNIAKDRTHYGFFFQQGAGKSCAVINTLRHIYLEQGRVLRTLVLCPPIVIENWKREFLMHSKINARYICTLTGPGKKRLELLRLGKAHIYITNYESLLMKEVYATIRTWRPQILIVDESHKCKSIKTRRSKLTALLANEAWYKFLLSGTPVLNSPLDLFQQFKIMDGGATFGKNFYAFRAKYFYDKNALMPRDRYFPNWQVREGALDAINREISKKSMRVKKSECLDLPPLVKQSVFVELSPEQQRLYKQMKNDFITYINSQACVAQIALTKALRLQQIVSGFAVVEGEEGERQNIIIKNNPRASALEELLSEIAPYHKVIVWCVFKQNYTTAREICEGLKLEYVECHGDIPTKKKFENVDRFNNEKDCRVFIGHPGSGGIGINLTSASYCIFYSRNFSLENDLQAEARNHRGGSEIHDKITRIDIVAKDTIDEAVLQRLHSKVEISERVLRDIVGEI